MSFRAACAMSLLIELCWHVHIKYIYTNNGIVNDAWMTGCGWQKMSFLSHLELLGQPAAQQMLSTKSSRSFINKLAGFSSQVKGVP